MKKLLVVMLLLASPTIADDQEEVQGLWRFHGAWQDGVRQPQWDAMVKFYDKLLQGLMCFRITGESLSIDMVDSSLDPAMYISPEMMGKELARLRFNKGRVDAWKGKEFSQHSQGTYRIEDDTLTITVQEKGEFKLVLKRPLSNNRYSKEGKPKQPESK